MNLAHLYYFKKLAETLHFTNTANELYISQSTLSLAISRLEEELNTQLFIRKRGTVELTEDGEVFYQYATAALNMLDNGVEVLADRVSHSKRDIRIGAIYSSQSRQWSALLKEYRRTQKGGITISLKQTTTPGVMNALRKGIADVGFGGKMDVEDNIAFYPLWAQKACLLVHKESPWSKRKSISLAELKDVPIITYVRDQAGIGNLTYELVKDYGLSVRYLFADEISGCALVAANPGQMAIVCHSWLVKAFENEVVPIPIEECPGPFRRLYMSYRLDVIKPKVVEEFISLAMSYPFEDYE